ncbi:MAG: prepilin-type N-terminal cleavage/methylation domain-containing protein [Blautia massiliensis]|uniref:pilus assembly FimT family protein n=1 Tax=Blautia massiliensis (ex Durand et al. 2017) TaxID=1737424 RepID=UPI00242DC422|nr:prepilin-type N-terminal cleavage/methylation domain-containing protein [Blautia massiliensis (ex Durand et al. 2017)]MCI7604087.1 prepilin-type N-terminal cleavage/methylation domain-containing protein [Blautia massiliensis (ex Durand et al. 2017)]
MKQLPEKKNRGFTLVEITVVLAIFAILLAVLVPSLDPVAGFRANRAAISIGAALDRTKTEAMDRLVGEMKLSWTSDGYYISYYLDRGKTGVREEQPEKIASGRMKISYTDSNGTTVNLREDGTNELILTYDRSTGGFLPIQSRVWEQKDILKMLSDGEDIPLDRPENSTQPYCEKITVHGVGQRTRIITLFQDTGKYTISAGKDAS